MLARVFVAVLLVLAVEQAGACTAKSWQPDELVENTPEVSANGRFTAIVRWHPSIPDFGSERADKALRGPDDEVPQTVVAALYEGRRPIAEVPLNARTTGYVLVSDSGRFLVAVDRGGPCGALPPRDAPVVTIYKTDGAIVATSTLADLLSPSDVAQMPFAGGDIDGASLRQESDGREVVVLTFTGRQTKDVERRIEVATGALLDEPVDIYPSPRVFVTSVRVTDSPRPYFPASPECTAAFADAVHLGSERFFSHAVDTPLPPFPIVAMKARIRGPIRLELLVSETGDVLCMRRSALPFGIDKATDEFAPRWKFEPYVVDGRAVKFAGELVLHFEDVLD